MKKIIDFLAFFFFKKKKRNTSNNDSFFNVFFIGIKLRIKENFPDIKAAITFVPVLAIVDNSVLGICVHGTF
jgi:hypothetical protein